MADDGNRVAQGIKRRGLIAGAAALAAGILAKQNAAPVGATSGTGGQGALILGSNTRGTAQNTPNTPNVSSVSTVLQATPNFGNYQSYGAEVLAVDASPAISGDLHGITGTGRGFGTGVQGFAPSIGVSGGGDFAATYGVVGYGTIYGIYGQSLGNGDGIYGTTGAPVDSGRAGVVAYGNLTGNYGVSGHGTNAATGVSGVSDSGVGVRGTSGSSFGVLGTSANVGVYGNSTNSYGVLGISTKPGFAGMTGITTTPNVAAFAGGSTIPTAEAARFNGDVTIDCTGPGFSSGFVVIPMSAKHGTVTHTDGTMRLMCSIEAPESWAEDIGKGKLVGGKATVAFDADYAAVIDATTLHVFLTPEGDSKGLYVTNKTATSFEVREQGGGTSSLTFSYRVMAHPKGQKVERLAKFTPHPVTLPKTAAEAASLATVPPLKIADAPPKPHTNP